ncbi:Coenzyme PQQ synthesis protein D [Rosistilla carotiformis]|uniref:Coenzyme PQQ synthesis protein D n=1 Tax=Rosistilla carotiformis TaxID=2528017 RepID=A0A518JWM4_9BACT|nr:site-2 protease family protein [Rosistilla carotiformis]QDV69942.1 Coenzyme PQQ synthesis protein D [Rosistilla carotiformis]
MYATGSPTNPIPLRMRDDLRVVPHVYRGEPTYVVGDLLALEYFRLNEQEHALLTALDGQHSVIEIKEQFEARFAPHRITQQEIQAYLIDFHKKGLLAGALSDSGRHLHRMGRRRKLKQRFSEGKNVLAFRWRGINPDRAFRLANDCFGWFFSKPIVIANVLLMLFAVAWLAAHADEFVARLPRMQTFFSGNNWLLLAIVLAAMKVLHEFGHGIVLTRYGRRCHELGVMLLVFMPTLYVNTSDSWRLADKWKRAAIAAAGVYVELVLAALATLGWWHSRPGGFQYVCLNVMFLGSVSAVLFNGNPLLKFDGYYMLCDLIEIPNLQKRSQTIVRNLFLRFAFGVREGDEDMLPLRTKVWLVGYLIAATLYRIVLIYVIAFLIVRLFRPAGLQEFAKMFSFLLVAMLAIVPLIGLVKYFSVPGRIHKIKPVRGIGAAVLLVAAMVFLFAVPLPSHVVCDFVVQPRDAQTVYVQHDAVLETLHVTPKQYVQKGEKIATLRDLDVELEIAELSGRLIELDSEQRMLRLTRYHAPSGSDPLSNLREQRLTIEQRLAQLNRIQQQMVLLAPQSGMVMPIWSEPPPQADADTLDYWDGWTLHAENVGTSFLRGQPICKIGNLGTPDARLTIDQSDIEFIDIGQPVELLLDSRSAVSIPSRIESISETDADQIRAHVSQQFGGTIETKPNESIWTDEIEDPQNARPAGAVYQAIAHLPETEQPLEDGLHGTARIAIGQQTLASRAIRFLQKTFRIDL